MNLVFKTGGQSRSCIIPDSLQVVYLFVLVVGTVECLVTNAAYGATIRQSRKDKISTLPPSNTQTARQPF
jgi:hypothetical protein